MATKANNKNQIAKDKFTFGEHFENLYFCAFLSVSVQTFRKKIVQKFAITSTNLLHVYCATHIRITERSVKEIGRGYFLEFSLAADTPD